MKGSGMVAVGSRIVVGILNMLVALVGDTYIDIFHSIHPYDFVPYIENDLLNEVEGVINRASVNIPVPRFHDYIS